MSTRQVGQSEEAVRGIILPQCACVHAYVYVRAQRQVGQRDENVRGHVVATLLSTTDQKLARTAVPGGGNDRRLVAGGQIKTLSAGWMRAPIA